MIRSYQNIQIFVYCIRIHVTGCILLYETQYSHARHDSLYYSTPLHAETALSDLNRHKLIGPLSNVQKQGKRDNVHSNCKLGGQMRSTDVSRVSCTKKYPKKIMYIW